MPDPPPPTDLLSPAESLSPADPTRLADADRLAALEETGLLDSPAERDFDRLTRLACRTLHAPVALVSLVTDDRQFFKSSAGLPLVWATARETPLTHSLCQYVVQTAQPLVVPDALADPQFRDSLAVPELGIRAYAGVPLVAPDGQLLGSFCVTDTEPRVWTDDDMETLRDLADSVQTEIALRMAARQARRQAQDADRARRETAALLESAAEGIYGIDLGGCATFLNPAAAQMLGWTPADLLGRDIHAAIHHTRPDGSPYPADDCPIARATQAGIGSHVGGDVFWRRDGTSFPVDYVSAPLIEDGRARGAVVCFSDITARRQAEAAQEAALARERHIAETLQRTILEDVPEDRFPGLAVASCYAGAWQEARVGGDFFDAFALDGGRAAFVVGDASGKGLAAAVRTAEVKFALRAFLHQDPSPATALARLNEFACAGQRLESRADDTFVAVAVAVIEADTGRTTVATAGAEPPLLIRADCSAEEVRCSGVPIGFLPGREYAPQELHLGPGDLLLLATDGVTEARRGKEFLGYPGMVKMACRAASGADGPGAVAQAILAGARAFAGGTLHDDACLLVIRRA